MGLSWRVVNSMWLWGERSLRSWLTVTYSSPSPEEEGGLMGKHWSLKTDNSNSLMASALYEFVCLIYRMKAYSLPPIYRFSKQNGNVRMACAFFHSIFISIIFKYGVLETKHSSQSLSVKTFLTKLKIRTSYFFHNCLLLLVLTCFSSTD